MNGIQRIEDFGQITNLYEFKISLVLRYAPTDIYNPELIIQHASNEFFTVFGYPKSCFDQYFYLHKLFAEFNMNIVSELKLSLSNRLDFIHRSVMLVTSDCSYRFCVANLTLLPTAKTVQTEYRIYYGILTIISCNALGNANFIIEGK